MSSNAEQMLQDIRSEFASLLDFVTGQEAQRVTVDHIERGLFRRLFALGAKLLTLFFAMRAQACPHEPITNDKGIPLPYHSTKQRLYFSIFGKIPFWRPYFYQAGEGGASPLDATLSLASDCYSDLLREWGEALSVYVAYEKAAEILQRFFGIELSTRVLKEMLAADAADVAACYAQVPPPAPASEAEILVIQADGKGVPMVRETPLKAPVRLGKGEKRARKKEAVVTSVYTIASTVRSPEEVVASYFHQEAAAAPAASRPVPRHKHLWATLEGKDAALTHLAARVTQREGPHLAHKIALTDGCAALQTRIRERFPDFTLILDFIHANEYLWQVANSLWGEQHPHRLLWVADHTLLMLAGRTAELIATLTTLSQSPERTAFQREVIVRTADYFQRNLPSMQYHLYLANGWPIASGVIEGACRHLVKDRMELSGMRWTQEGAEQLLHLRSVAENGDWETYHRFRRWQRHTRLYRLPFPDQGSPEEQSFKLAA
jgi:hypothetical protein